jgi:hypothetical protein
MSNLPTDVDDFHRELECVRDRLRESHLSAVREVLTDEIILRACSEVGMQFRKRILPPIITVLHMIAAAFCSNASNRSDSSFRSAWNAFGSERVSSGALSRARGRLPEQLWRGLCSSVADVAAAASTPWSSWRGHRVVDLDGTCVSMEDNPVLKEEFGVNTGKHGPGRYPLARLVVAMLWGTMTIVDHVVGEYRSSEWALTTQMLARLQSGDLVVGDRHFAAAHYYVMYARHELEYITRAHQRLKVGRLRRLVEHSNDDFITELALNQKHLREDPTLPKRVTVRFIRVEARVRGEFKSLWLVTSLLDPKQYPASEIAQLYAGRWKIETVFRELKVACGADVLRSKKPSGVRNEIAARIVAVNLVRTIMIDAAHKYDRAPTTLSFSAALRAIGSTSIRMAAASTWQLPALYELMLNNIASEQVPDRPGRNEPRVVCRERKHYSHLRGSRADWRRKHAAY